MVTLLKLPTRQNPLYLTKNTLQNHYYFTGTERAVRARFPRMLNEPAIFQLDILQEPILGVKVSKISPYPNSSPAVHRVKRRSTIMLRGCCTVTCIGTLLPPRANWNIWSVETFGDCRRTSEVQFMETRA